MSCRTTSSWSSSSFKAACQSVLQYVRDATAASNRESSVSLRLCTAPVAATPSIVCAMPTGSALASPASRSCATWWPDTASALLAWRNSAALAALKLDRRRRHLWSQRRRPRLRSGWFWALASKQRPARRDQLRLAGFCGTIERVAGAASGCPMAAAEAERAAAKATALALTFTFRPLRQATPLELDYMTTNPARANGKRPARTKRHIDIGVTDGKRIASPRKRLRTGATKKTLTRSGCCRRHIAIEEVPRSMDRCARSMSRCARSTATRRNVRVRSRRGTKVAGVAAIARLARGSDRATQREMR